MCGQSLHRIGILRDQAGLMLLCREQHVVQQVNIGIAAKGVVKWVIGIVHGARLLDQNWL